MSLNHLSAIPVDTHVLKIAVDHYLPKGRLTKSMTPKLYAEIGDAFRDVYGPMVLFFQLTNLYGNFDLFFFSSKGWMGADSFILC